MFSHQSQGFVQRIQRSVARVLIATMLLLDFPILMTTQTAQAAPLMTDPADWVEVDIPNDPMMENLNVPANAASAGMWSPVFSWPMNGLHNSILPDGKVLTYGTTASGYVQDGRLFDVWDPTLGFGANSHNTSYQAQQQDSFCSTAAYLSDGTMLITGGNSDNGGSGKGGLIYNPVNNTRSTAAASTALPRWYSTMLTLPDSRKIILGGMQPYTEGMWVNPDQSVQAGYASMTPEVYEGGQWRSLFGASSRDAFGPDFLRTSYPHAFVAPNGQVFGISAEKMWYLDANANGGNGAMPYVANFKRGFGNMADPVNVGALSVAVMYDIGKIIQVGGNGGSNGDGFAASNMATVFDLNNGAPQLTEEPRMNFPRRYGNGIVLANGQVVITGGTTLGNYNAGDERSRGSQAVYAAEIWDPNTGNWTVGASAATIRVYHSITSLLTNGAILSTGGGAPGPVTNLNGEVYYPPYLFTQSGNGSELAERPVIDAISGLKYSHNAPIEMDMASNDPVSGLALIGLSSGTHSFNAGQRRIPLSFTQENNRLTATTPNANLTPPGYYQVVALDAQGVPSYGVVVAIGQDLVAPNVPTNPYTPPELDDNIAVPVISAGGTGNYTTTAVNGYTYSWNFGDGSSSTAFNADPTVSHTYTQAGAYVLTLSVKDNNNIVTTKTVMQAVATSQTAQPPASATPIVTDASGRVWVVNPDNDSVGVVNGGLIAEIAVEESPRSVAIAPDGRVWVTNKASATISIIDPVSLAVVQTVTLPRASQPHGLAFAPNGSAAYVALEATGQLLKLNVNTGNQIATTTLGLNVRGVAVSADSNTVLVSRFVTPPLPGESTLNVDTSTQGGEVIVVSADSMSINKTIMLRHSDKVDNEIQGSGLPNYLAAPVISPDGKAAWVPSKQDNIKRGTARNGQNLDFQNTVRAISSKIDMSTLTEDYAKRVDHDNSSVGSAAVYHPNGVYLFVALETSRQVAVVDAINGNELFKIEVGLAPQGVALSADGNTLYVQEFMGRTVRSVDLTPLTVDGQLDVGVSTATYSIASEKLPLNVLAGKQMFYDAKDTRLAKDSYMSCASCHNDAGSDGRVWDLTGFGEGLRNTIALKGRASTGHGFLHWSANFDELQDFEGQIRTLSGGTGLMSDADFNAGTRNQPLGDKKAGVSDALDQLADYVASLLTFAKTPHRNNDGTLTSDAVAGEAVFKNNCSSCHAGTNFTVSKDASQLKNIGTINVDSGKRLNGTLDGIDVPTLRDVWATAPYLHNGSAATIADAVQAHNNVALNAAELANVVAYVQQIGVEEVVASSAAGSWQFNEGSGNTIADASGNNHPLTLNNGTWVAGKAGQAAQFNGANTSASTTTSIVDTANSFTVSAWVKLDSLNGWQTFVNQDGVNVSSFWLQYSEYVNNNKFVFNMHDADSQTSASYKAVSTTTPVVGQWYHLVGVRDKAAGTMKLYVNGQLEGTTAYAGGWPSNGTFNVGRGKWGNSNDWVNGAIDAVSAYTGAISATEVAAIYQAQGGDNSPANVAPTVSLTSPATNAAYTVGDAIAVTANASDSDGTIAKVEFYDGTTLLATDSVAPYAYTWDNAGEGTHAITAKATDNSDEVTTSAVVSITVNAPTNTPPADAITCANENGTCTIPTGSTVTVWYGANASWAVKTDVTANIGCNNAIFGDPIKGTFKSCKYQVTSELVNQAPTVNLTTPVANAIYTVGDAITVEATASDADGSITSVAFYADGDLLNTDIEAPYTYTWTGAAEGAHNITARAVDDDAAVTTSAAVAVTVEAAVVPNLAPTVSLTSPIADAVYSAGDMIVLAATAADSDGEVSKVEFYDGQTLISTDTTAPYRHDWPAQAGNYSITAKAYDNDGAVTTSSIVNVKMNENVEVNFNSPTAGTTFTEGDVIPISVTASSADSTVAKVDFYDGQTLLSTDTAAPYAFNWNNASVGAHTIRVEVLDNFGALSVRVVSIIVEPATNIAPTVTLTAPVANATYILGDAITLTAAAADSDGTVASVAFYDGDSLLGTDATAPYSYTWTGASASVGTHSITARATDNDGVQTISASVNVTVREPGNAEPEVAIVEPSTNVTLLQGSPYSLTASASDSDGSISKVEFYYNGNNLLGIVTAAPYTITGSTGGIPVGEYSITAKAFDNQGAIATSAPLIVTVTDELNTPPTVNVTSPVINAAYTVGDAINIAVTAVDNDGAITKVEFYDGPILLGTDTTAPYAYTWNGASEGAHSITARASDNDGAVTISAPVDINVNASVPPTVSLNAPSITTGEAVELTATAADADGTVVKVEFYDGATLLYTDTTAPYRYTWNTTVQGVHTMTAKAVDNTGATATSIAVNVRVDANQNDRPIVNLITPIDNAEYSVGDVVTITATATDSDGTIANVAFYSGGELLNVDTTAPYTFNWTATKGIHSISALATDNQGGFNRSSTANINVIEVNNDAPTVSLTAPVDNAVYTVGDVITLSATANDTDGSILNVRFIDEVGRTLFNDTQAPYTFNWTNVAEGTYQVAARAWDDGGSYTTSSFVTITVSAPTNVAPEVAIVVPNANVTVSQGAPYTITASASDSDGSISKVEFYYNGTNLLDTKTQAPYTTAGSTAGIPPGEYAITAKAYDNNGAVMTSEAIVITVR